MVRPSESIAIASERRRGRGAISNVSGRFEAERCEAVDDGWESLGDLPPLRTHVQPEAAKRIITRNSSPDIPFDRSINPYRGCEHGCIYCFARPTHSFMGLSAGLDFETRLFVKPEAAALLRCELARPSYTPGVIAIGTNTDPYQPIERRWQVTRRILEVLDETSHPVSIVTKSALVLRDTDILARLARRRLVHVTLSVTTLDGRLARSMEPRASTPARRLDAIARLSAAGIPTGVMVAPVIASLNESEMERILEAAKTAGARRASTMLLRLPLEIKVLFREWLVEHFPDRARRVIGLLRTMHGSRDTLSDRGRRRCGSGPYADQIARRFVLAVKRLGFEDCEPRLRTALFTPPARSGRQLSLFD